MKQIISCILLILCTSFSAFAQKNIVLNLQQKLGANPFNYNTSATNDLNKNFKITRLDYYISKVKIIHDGNQITPINDYYIFVKASANMESFQLGSFNNIGNIEGIKFSIGVDSPNNNADPTTWSTGHPLAPKSPSMHWGWASGYRFVALEGTAGTSNTPYELHGLFNENFFEQTIPLSGVTNGNNISINIEANYVEALKGIDVEAGPIQHGVNNQDLTVLENFRDNVFKAAVATSVKSVVYNSSDVKIYPNPANGYFTINLLNQNALGINYKIVDVTGKTLLVGQLSKNNEKQNIQSLQSGFYFVNVYANKELIANKRLVIH